MKSDKDAVAKENLGLVHACCKRFTGKGIEYDELYSAGCLGLAKAINNFDESLNYKFSTYAFPVIMGEIKRLFRDGGAIKVSRSLKELYMSIGKVNSEYAAEHGKEPTVTKLAEILNVSCEKIIEALDSAKAPVSLTADNDESGQSDIPTDDIQYEISEKLSLRQAVSSLDECDKKIITLRYYCNKTQSFTAKRLNMTQVQVSRREKKILMILRGKMSG